MSPGVITGMNIEALGLVSDVDVSKGYKYLGVLQDLLISHQTVKDNLIREYRSRLRSVFIVLPQWPQ